MPVDGSKMDQIIAAAKKRNGGVQNIRPGNAIMPVKKIPFDSLELNLATYGGAPLGRMMRMWGGWSSCKSTVALGLIKQAQAFRDDDFPEGLTCVYYDIEGSFDSVYAESLGVDTSPGRLTIVDDVIIEDVSENLDALLHAANVHVLDTASAAISAASFNAPKESRQPGFNSQAWQRAFQSAESNMDKRENLIVVIDQVRTDFKTGAQKPAGGNMADHVGSMSLKHRKAKNLYRTDDGDLVDTRPQKGNDPLTGSHRIDGYEVEIEVTKSKVCRPFGKARLRFDVDKAKFDPFFELKKAGLFLGVIQQSGAYYTIPNNEKSIHGEKALMTRLSEDFALITAIKNAATEYIAQSQR